MTGPLLQGTAKADSPLLELGCDSGGDTAWLLQQGFGVIATDISMEALQQCAVAAPDATRCTGASGRAACCYAV